MTKDFLRDDYSFLNALIRDIDDAVDCIHDSDEEWIDSVLGDEEEVIRQLIV